MHAQQGQWPTRPIRWIIPWGAGGSTDVIGRTIAQKLSEKWPLDAFEPGVIRASELWPDEASLQRHTQAPHIAPWHEACRQFGMTERRFTIIEVAQSRVV